MSLIAMFGEHLCSDSRDKVYSMIGLVKEWRIPGNITVRADYSLTLEELFDLMETRFGHEPMFPYYDSQVR